VNQGEKLINFKRVPRTVTTEKSILITRELRPGSLIRQWANETKIQLTEMSFIETVSVTGLSIPETDWIFFSSPQSANLYFETYPLKAKKIAALSEGTADALLQLGHPTSFTGDSSKATKQIGTDFFNQVKSSELVLFPLSDISKKQVSAQKGNHTIIELITYKTALVPIKLQHEQQVILFTSPSNVDGFLLKNQLTEKTGILAIGETTASRLRELGFDKITVSESTNEKALVKALQALI
jgi:hydroxymethylbilane synthase